MSNRWHKLEQHSLQAREEKLTKLMQAKAAFQAQEVRIDQLNQMLGDYQSQLASLQARTHTPRQILDLIEFTTRIRKLIDTSTQKLNGLMQRVNEAQRDLLEAEQTKMKYARLNEKTKEQGRRQENHREQASLEQASANRFAANQKALGTTLAQS